MSYLSEFPVLTSYVPVFLLALFFAEFRRDKINVIIIMTFFVLSPAMRISAFPESNFFLFYSCYELFLFSALFMYNGIRERYIALYALSMAGFFVNFGSFYYWSEYSQFIHAWYPLANKTLIEATFFCIILFANKERAALFAALLFISPYFISLV